MSVDAIIFVIPCFHQGFFIEPNDLWLKDQACHGYGCRFAQFDLQVLAPDTSTAQQWLQKRRPMGKVSCEEIPASIASYAIAKRQPMGHRFPGVLAGNENNVQCIADSITTHVMTKTCPRISAVPKVTRTCYPILDNLAYMGLLYYRNGRVSQHKAGMTRNTRGLSGIHVRWIRFRAKRSWPDTLPCCSIQPSAYCPEECGLRTHGESSSKTDPIRCTTLRLLCVCSCSPEKRSYCLEISMWWKETHKALSGVV